MGSPGAPVATAPPSDPGTLPLDRPLLAVLIAAIEPALGKKALALGEMDATPGAADHVFQGRLGWLSGFVTVLPRQRTLVVLQEEGNAPDHSEQQQQFGHERGQEACM